MFDQEYKDYMYHELFQEYPEILTVEDIQKMLNIGRNAAYMLVKNLHIKSCRVGSKYVIPKCNVVEYLMS